MPTEDEACGFMPTAHPIEVYSSSNSSLPTNISSKKKKEKDREAKACQRRTVHTDGRSQLENETSKFFIIGQFLRKKCTQIVMQVFPSSSFRSCEESNGASPDNNKNSFVCKGISLLSISVFVSFSSS